MDEQMDGWMHTRLAGWMDGWTRLDDGWLDKWMDGYKESKMDR